VGRPYYGRCLSLLLLLGPIGCQAGTATTEPAAGDSQRSIQVNSDKEPSGPVLVAHKTHRPMRVGAAYAAVVAGLDRRIYVISGFDKDLAGQPRELTNLNRAYDPGRDEWTELGPIPTPRTSPGAAVGPDGRIYVIGGARANFKAVNDVAEAYDPKTDRWSRLRALPTPRDSPCAVAAKCANGRVLIYTIGGRAFRGPNENLGTVEAYDPASDTWAAMAPMPTPRHAFTATLGPDGRIYAVGGCPGSKFTDVLEIYDPVKNAWTKGASMPYPQECACSASTPGPAGEVLVFGGRDVEQRELRTVVAYNPRTNTWRALAPLSGARQAAGVAALTAGDGSVLYYIVGGTPRSDTMEEYVFRNASSDR
jgi:N-acetylneuraminic acid mutarotase